MDTKQIFIASDEALTNVVNQIKDDQWEFAVPKEINKEPWTLKKIINYHAYDEAWVPDVLAGKTIAEVGTKYDGDLLRANPKDSWKTIVEKATQAVHESDLSKTVHLSYGDFSGKEYLEHISTFRVFRAVTIARFIGVDDTLNPELVESMITLLEPNIEYWRKMGVFGPAKATPENATRQEYMLTMAGYEVKR